MFDYLIVGAGLFGSTCAFELNKYGYKCLVIEKRSHIGGNCYTEKRDDINIHVYGPHIFHTSSTEIWQWINQFAVFNNFIFSPIANHYGKIYSLPFNMWTFSQLWNIASPQEAKKIIENQSFGITNPSNLEEQAIKSVGTDIYNTLIKEYTIKQWQTDPKNLPKEIIKRIPVRYTYNNNYFNDKYQGIPIGGYTQIFRKLLQNIEVKYNINYLINKDYWNQKAKKIIYTGPIDEFYNYKFGELSYRTTQFDHHLIYDDNFQGVAVVNHTGLDKAYTRTIEHKHFEYGNQNHTWVTYETPIIYTSKKTEQIGRAHV